MTTAWLTRDVDRHGLYNGPARRYSRWFTRGCKLQELLAPQLIEFYDERWDLIGMRSKLIDRLAFITMIDAAVLSDSRVVSEMSIATRMFWAARRETTRLEDQAYSLLGT